MLIEYALSSLIQFSFDVLEERAGAAAVRVNTTTINALRRIFAIIMFYGTAVSASLNVATGGCNMTKFLAFVTPDDFDSSSW